MRAECAVECQPRHIATCVTRNTQGAGEQATQRGGENLFFWRARGGHDFSIRLIVQNSPLIAAVAHCVQGAQHVSHTPRIGPRPGAFKADHVFGAYPLLTVRHDTAAAFVAQEHAALVA